MEFTLVCIPLLFILVSIVEISRGMWAYSTLAYAVKKATRFTVVHGQSCAAASASCPVTIGTVAQVLRANAVGLVPDHLNVTLQTANSSQTCYPLRNCLNNNSAWPPSGDGEVGTPVTISGNYPFRTAMAMFWPGAGAVHFSAVTLTAKSQEEIAF